MPTACAVKFKVVAERLTSGAVRVPVRVIVWEGGLALSVIVIEPGRDPVAEGEKVMLIVQEEPRNARSACIGRGEVAARGNTGYCEGRVTVVCKGYRLGELVVSDRQWPKSYDDGESAATGIAVAVYLVTKALVGSTYIGGQKLPEVVGKSGENVAPTT